MVIHGIMLPWQEITKLSNSTDVNRTVRFSDLLQRCDTSCNRDRPVGIADARCALFFHAINA